MGAAKSGTTSLYRYLQAHPHVYLPDSKEPMYFVSDVQTRISLRDPRHQVARNNVVTCFDAYQRMFEGAGSEADAIGEASPIYLYYHEVAIPRIRRQLGDVKIVIILRNPIDRAFSSYCHLRRDGFEHGSFEAFLEGEEERRRDNWNLLNFPVAAGLYHDQIAAYLDAFSDVKVVLLEDLRQHPKRTMKQLLRFLQVEPMTVPDTEARHNASAIHRSAALDRVIRCRNPLGRAAATLLRAALPDAARQHLKTRLEGFNRLRIKTATRDRLKDCFADDVLRTQQLIGRDLTHWLR